MRVKKKTLLKLNIELRIDTEEAEGIIAICIRIYTPLLLIAIRTTVAAIAELQPILLCHASMVMAETLSRRSPIKVGFYDIVKTIGRGNFAEVKLAKHRITKTEVCHNFFHIYTIFYVELIESKSWSVDDTMLC